MKRSNILCRLDAIRALLKLKLAESLSGWNPSSIFYCVGFRALSFIRPTLASCILWLGAQYTYAADGDYFVNHIQLNTRDTASLQRGARLYFNYCASCHSLSYVRYQQVAKIAKIQDPQGRIYQDLIKKNIAFDDNADINTLIKSAMSPDDAKQWFGIAAPDLTNIALIHSPTWIYNFLRGFYSDASRPFGANNLIAPGTAMPNALLPLRGETTPIYINQHFDHYITTSPGSMTPLDFDRAMLDLVNFLTVVAEPNRFQQVSIGVGVICDLALLLLLVYFWYRSQKYRIQDSSHE